MRAKRCFIALVVIAGSSTGFAYDQTQKSPQSPEATAELKAYLAKLVPAAESGDASAQETLGLLFYAAQDGAGAAQWLRLAANQGRGMAQSALGDVLLKGLGVPKDLPEAATWSLKGAEQGHFLAQGNLAAMYAEGLGVVSDDVEALKWARKAAEQDCAASSRAKCASVRAMVGGGFFVGAGVPRDFVQAYFWANMAAAIWPVELGENRPAKLREDVAARMTPQQIAEAQQLSREWKPKPFKNP